MRRGKKFSNKPKRTHEERRRAIEPDWLLELVRFTRMTKHDAAVSCARVNGMSAAGAKIRRLGLWSWMKRAHYLAEYNIECRRGKWRQRAARGQEKRADRAYMKHLSQSATLVFPDGRRIRVNDFSYQIH